MSRKLLVIDDDEGTREALEDHFLELGLKVLAVENAEAALARLWAFEPDLILTDIRMGEMSGLELLERLRQLEHPADVVVMTGHENMRETIRAIRAGAYDYLVKPLNLEELDALVNRCFRDRRARNRMPDAVVPVTSPEAGMIVGRSPGMVKIWKQIGMLSDVHTPVLIRGETGTGKELVARAIHNASPWRAEPFVAINCTAVAETLLESELFGHVRGAFTGAVGDRRGRFELAGSGTIFLDEIGETSLSFQAKLLRVIQEKEYYPVGSERPRKTTARVVAATHRPLEQMVKEGTFREDLYFRLRVLEIQIPPLRDRIEDLPILVEHLTAKFARELNKEPVHVPRTVMRMLEGYSWPGNVRELENTLIRATVLARGPSMRVEDLAFGAPTSGAGTTTETEAERTLEGAERRHVDSVLRSCGHNKSRAARALGISRPRLDRILAKSGAQGEEEVAAEYA
jgi:two-component system, NtrC family, response regulator AtoC